MLSLNTNVAVIQHHIHTSVIISSSPLKNYFFVSKKFNDIVYILLPSLEYIIEKFLYVFFAYVCD